MVSYLQINEFTTVEQTGKFADVNSEVMMIDIDAHC